MMVHFDGLSQKLWTHLSLFGVNQFRTTEYVGNTYTTITIKKNVPSFSQIILQKKKQNPERNATFKSVKPAMVRIHSFRLALMTPLC